MILKNGLIHDSVCEQPYLASIALRDGKIAEIGTDIVALENEEVLDLGGKNVYPGFVDAHSHLGMSTYGVGAEGSDINEMNDIITPHLRAIDSFNPQSLDIRMALEGGVTTVGTGPGSANVLGGIFMAVKTHGTCVDDMVLKTPIAMKCAFGENPKRCYKDKGDCARMTTAAKMRDTLFQAQEYMARKEAAGDDIFKRPKFDIKMEAMIPVLKGDIPLKAHVHRADDICTAIRIAKEFNLKMTLEHCTEGHLIVKEVLRSGFSAAVGPTMTNAGKIEMANKSFETPGILQRAGVKVSIITDAPVIGQQHLPMCAGLAVKAGMDRFEALKAITINPAEHLGISDRVGSLEVGKDGDVVVADGDILSSTTNVLMVFLNGEKVVG